MKNKNGIDESREKIFPYYKSIESFKSIKLQVINEKLSQNNLEIEDVLQSDECINDLTSNPNTIYKPLITLKNIYLLIKYCLFPDNKMNKLSQKFLRYPYYSCQILCSSCVLNFDKSIQNIKEASNQKKSEDKKESDSKKSKKNNNILSENEIANIEKNNFSEKNYFVNPLEDEDISDYYENFFSQSKTEIENDIEEKYIDILKNNNQATETSLKNDKPIEIEAHEYDEEDMNIIYSIWDEIFKILDHKDFREDQNCIGYFGKMANYSLIHVPDILIKYLFKDDEHLPIIQKFYKNLDKPSVSNVLENILNILADKENEINDIKDSKYILIIKYCWSELINENNFEKIEFICKLTINTLIINSEDQLIEVVFKNNGLNVIKNLIEKIIVIKDNDKILIPILEMIIYLNDVFMISFNNSEIFKENNIILDIYLNDSQNTKIFDYKYIRKQNISNKKILENFQQNVISYFKTIIEIFNIIKQHIINTDTSNNKYFGLKNLYEWKFILSSLKIYVYSFYVTNINLEKIEYNFSYEILFHISVKLYFIYYQNNIYQNIFIGIINIICNEKCPSYLTEYFLLTNKSNQNLIDLIISNLENGNNNKINKLLVGPNIEILKLFYYSNNKTIEKFLKKDLYENYKNLYKKYITPKFERKLNNDYNFSDSEIFINDNNETFDGKDINAKYIKVNSIQQTLQNFLDKCKYEKDINKKTRRISIKKIKRNKENIIKEKSNITTYNNLKERETILERTFPNNESPFEIEISSKFELKNN